MRRDKKSGDSAPQPQFQIRLPGFVTGDELGLGDAVKHVGYALGIKPCDGCGRRAAALNRWVAFTGGHK